LIYPLQHVQGQGGAAGVDACIRTFATAATAAAPLVNAPSSPTRTL
jgi:hypothetical protein